MAAGSCLVKSTGLDASEVMPWEPDYSSHASRTNVDTLESRGADVRWLIVRATGAPWYRALGLPPAVSIPVARLMHFIMERGQLLGIARRAEALPG